MNSNAIVDQAFNALEETAKVVRGQLEEAKSTKKKNAAYWHAMLFSAISKNPTKLQAVHQRLEKWIADDIESSIPDMLGAEKAGLQVTSSGSFIQEDATNGNNNNSGAPATNGDEQEEEDEITREMNKAMLVDEAAVQRICDSFTAYKRIAFAATVIFEVIDSSKTVKIDITKLMMRGYRDRIFKSVKGALFKYISHHVTLCRRKEELMPSGGGLLKNACRMFATVAQQYENPKERVDFYDKMFVRKYHEHALSEAKIDVQDFLRQPQAIDGLLTWAEERIAFETRLVELFLHDDQATDVNHPLAQKRFRRQLVGLFVVPYLEEIISHPSCGFSANLSSGNWAKLKQQFSWASAEKDRCPVGADLIVQALVEFAKNQIQGVITAFNEQTFDTTVHAATFLVTGIYDLSKTIFTNLLSSFADEGGAATLQRPVKKEMCRTLTNCKLTRKVSDKARGNVHTVHDHFADLLCIYVDVVLRDAKLLPSGDDYQTFCRTQVSELFSLLEDRDIFAEHYRLRLAKRLLQATWEEDNELAVLEVLQRQVGKLYTHKFEGMIFDVQSAQSLQELYGESPSAASAAAASSSSQPLAKLEPKVLTAAYWPTLKRDDDFVPPESMTQVLGGFERFYRNKFPTRQLRWQAERGTATLSVSFPKGVREVSCSVYQASIMIAIDAENASSGISVGELSKKTGIEIKELKPLVASMLLAKGLNLIRTGGENPLNSKFTENDKVEMNPDFTCRMRKIKLPSAITARSTASDSVGQNVIDASRGQMLDAAIVRVMKSRKQMRMQDLVDAIMNQVTKFFIPQPRDIKQRVEFLIQKEFLERDDDENDLFRYLA